MARHGFLILICSFSLAIFSSLNLSFSAPEPRSALVIGNGNYKSAPLRNPVHDANDIANALRNLGFTVTHIQNASQRGIETAIRQFGESLRKGGVGLFYYAGHGLQVDGINYMVPIDAQIRQETDIKYEAVDARRVLDAMYNAGNPCNIVILDACRDNPVARSFRSGSIGLARMDAPKGTIVAYSTSPGKVALYGRGRNSPYTSALLEYMDDPGLTIEQVFKKCRGRIYRATNGKQIPWESTSLIGDFFFVGVATHLPVAPTILPAAQASTVHIEGPIYRDAAEYPRSIAISPSGANTFISLGDRAQLLQMPKGRMSLVQKPDELRDAYIDTVVPSHSDICFYADIRDRGRLGKDPTSAFYTVNVETGSWEHMCDTDGWVLAAEYVASKRRIYGILREKGRRGEHLISVDPATRTIEKLRHLKTNSRSDFTASDLVEIADGVLLFNRYSGTVRGAGPVFRYDVRSDDLAVWDITNARKLALTGRGEVLVFVQGDWGRYDLAGNYLGGHAAFPPFFSRMAKPPYDFSYNSRRTLCAVRNGNEYMVFPMELWR